MQFAASSLDGRDSHYLGTYLAKQVPRYVKVLYQTTYIHLLQDFYYAQLQNGSNRVRTAIHPDNIGLHVHAGQEQTSEAAAGGRGLNLKCLCLCLGLGLGR